MRVLHNALDTDVYVFVKMLDKGESFSLDDFEPRINLHHQVSSPQLGIMYSIMGFRDGLRETGASWTLRQLA